MLWVRVRKKRCENPTPPTHLRPYTQIRSQLLDFCAGSHQGPEENEKMSSAEQAAEHKCPDAIASLIEESLHETWRSLAPGER